jgi:NhaC family Na+:H+ antiporter
MNTHTKENIKNPSLIISLIPMFTLIILLLCALLVFDIDIQIPLIIATSVASLIAVIYLRNSWNDIEQGIFDSVQSAMQAIFIACIIGFIIASWIMGGIVPTIIYYGLKLLSPNYFLVTCLIISSVVGIATGSSWTTTGTIGIALIGIGLGLSIPPEVTAGAVISGAFIGDKISPFSDTTNLAAVVSGTTLFVHIKNMMWTTMTSCILSGIMFQILNFKYTENIIDQGAIDSIMKALNQSFNINIFLLLPVALIIIIMAKQSPAIPGLLFSVLLGLVCAFIFQHVDINTMGEALEYGYVSNTGNEIVDNLLSRGGMQNMMWTVSLIFCSLSFGGVMEKSGMLNSIATEIMKLAKSNALLGISTMATAIFVTLSTGEQYLSILITGKMYSNEYKTRGLAPQNLSRALEDAGTMTSPLIPWSTCAVAISTYLGVSTVKYLPYCFVNLLNPIVGCVFLILGFKIIKIDRNEK